MHWLSIAVIVIGLTACAVSPTARNTVTFKTPSGKTVECLRPPEEAPLASAKADVDVTLPKIKEVLKASASAERKFEQLLPLNPKLQAWEVYCYRMQAMLTMQLFSNSLEGLSNN